LKCSSPETSRRYIKRTARPVSVAERAVGWTDLANLERVASV
jgi:hypothetical protein